MDRRSFTRFALSGLAVSCLPESMSRAALPAALPAAAFGPRPDAATVALAAKPFAPLLERARLALEKHGSSLKYRDRVALADFSAPSRSMRFHIVDLIGGQTSSYLVAHGRGSDPGHSGWLHSFSNEPNSLASSSGAYRTGDYYVGKHGRSMRLIGLDPQNNNAEQRAIVVHGADYVSETHVASWGKCGRSEGCFAVAQHILPQVLGLIGPGRLVYADKLGMAKA
ncbi:MAG: murein L,D-transpeptidase catalytic domain family protein [Sphingobium sp.]